MIDGKIEAGVVKKGNLFYAKCLATKLTEFTGVQYLLMPNKAPINISALYGETEDEVDAASCGEQVRIRIRGVEEEDISMGAVLCSKRRPVHFVRAFEAQVVSQCSEVIVETMGA